MGLNLVNDVWIPVRPVEHAWGGAPEPALHRLLRDLVGEAHERRSRDGATSRRR